MTRVFMMLEYADGNWAEEVLEFPNVPRIGDHVTLKNDDDTEDHYDFECDYVCWYPDGAAEPDDEGLRAPVAIGLKQVDEATRKHPYRGERPLMAAR